MNVRTLGALAILVSLAAFWPRPVGAADLSLAWDPPSDGVTTGYILSYGTAPGSYSQQVNVGYTTTYLLSGLSDGSTYYFVVQAYDAAGNLSAPSNQVTATALASTQPVVTSLTLTPSAPSPQMLGTTVNWAATATGGVTPYEFLWSVYQNGAWTVGSWTSASTYAWTPSSAGSDQVSVAVRSSGSTSTTGELSQTVPYTVTAPPAVTVTLTSNLPPPQVVGTKVTWSAAVAGGVAPYQYEWWLYDGTAWNAMTSWTTSSKWNWTPTVANSAYAVRVWVMNAGNTTNTPDATASVPFAIIAAAKTCHGAKCK